MTREEWWEHGPGITGTPQGFQHSHWAGHWPCCQAAVLVLWADRDSDPFGDGLNPASDSDQSPSRDHGGAVEASICRLTLVGDWCLGSKDCRLSLERYQGSEDWCRDGDRRLGDHLTYRDLRQGDLRQETGQFREPGASIPAFNALWKESAMWESWAF